MTFDDIEIDIERYQLRRAGQVVSVEPKVFDLIAYLAQEANRLISKDELIEHVWAGRIVSDAALSSAIKSARRALSDGDLNDSRIKTVRGRGFRMELPTNDAASEATQPAEANDAPIFVQPSFVVLPPTDLPEGLDGAMLQRRLSTTISRVPFMTVVAPAVARKLGNAAPAEIAETVGRGYALDVTGHPGGVDCVLYSTETAATLWSFETEARDLDALIAAIAPRLEIQLSRAIQAKLSMLPADRDPELLTMQALGTMTLKGWNRNSFAEAEEKLRRAHDVDPDMPFARAALALIMALGPRIGLVAPDEARRQEAIAHAERAIELEPMSSHILGFAGCALVDAGQTLRGKAVLERGVSLDPMNPQALAALGTTHIVEKRLDSAVEMLSKSLDIIPQDGRVAVWGSMLSIGCMMQGDHERAMIEAERAVSADDQTHLSRVVLAAVALSKGDMQASAAAWADARRVTPSLTEDQAAAVIGGQMAAKLTEAFGVA